MIKKSLKKPRRVVKRRMSKMPSRFTQKSQPAPKVDTRAISKRVPEKKRNVEEAAGSCYGQAAITLSTVPYPVSRLQSMRSPFTVDREMFRKFNNFGDCPRTCGDGQFMPESDFPFYISLGPANNSPMGKRLNSPLFNSESGGYALSMNGIVGGTMWLCVGDRITISYFPGECKRRRRVLDGEDFICITADPFGGNNTSFTNDYSKNEHTQLASPSLEPEPIFGTQRIYRNSSEIVDIAPWMAYQNVFLVENTAVGTFLRIVILACC